MQSSFRPRRGISLMEVLISIFVLSIGLLGLAALIPVGRFAVVQTSKSDRAGACGRAGLRDLKVRRMLDPQYHARQLVNQYDPQPFAIDPLGLTNPTRLPGVLTGTNIPRVNLTWTANEDAARRVFEWQDDQQFGVSEDPAVRTTASTGPNGHYSWFCTVVPAVAEKDVPWSDKTLFTVSVAVCYRRNYNMNPPPDDPRPAEASATATLIDAIPPLPNSSLKVCLGGGSLILDKVVAVKENDWILLYAPASGGVPLQCNWYRVVAVGEDAAAKTQTYLTVAGPDWYTSNSTATAVIVDSVIGVYTETVELDTGLWNK